MSARDARTDSSRTGSTEGRRERWAYEVPMGAMTVAEENANRGWRRTTKPTGAKEPMPLRTSGNRGADDADLDNDGM